MAFKKGQSGNPKGRPHGSKHKATLAAQALLDGEVEALTRKCIEKALDGDGFALKLCLDRILPPRKDRPVNLRLPKVAGVRDIPAALTAILEAVGKGALTPTEGQTISGMLESVRKALETADIERRLSALEEKMQEGKDT